MRIRLDQMLAQTGQTETRSQAESYIKLGKVEVNGKIIKKPNWHVDATDKIKVLIEDQYVSRAALKLASVSEQLKLNFKDKVILDVGSSTGGFTDFALSKGAHKVFAVDVGTDQMHPRLRSDERVNVYEQTDIRDFKFKDKDQQIDIVVIDVSFISLRDILPSISKLVGNNTQIIAMVKPQFEAVHAGLKHKGVIKNDHMRRDILKSFEQWASSYFVIQKKLDSGVTGAKGNKERFYLLKKQ